MQLKDYLLFALITGLGLAVGGAIGWISFALSPIGPEAIGFMPSATFWGEALIYLIVAVSAPALLRVDNRLIPYFIFGAVFALFGPGVPFASFPIDALASALGQHGPSSAWASTRFVAILVVNAIARFLLSFALVRVVFR